MTPLALADDLAAALDPTRLMLRCGMTPDAWQAALLHSSALRMLLLCSRQAGKSTVAAVLALYEALYHPPALVLLLSPSLRQSAELFHTVAQLYGRLGEPVPPDQESALRMELANRSRIISLPAKEGTIRGYGGVRLLVVDEAARVPDELIHACRPMLATSGGRLIALSTPFGKGGWFYEAWQDGGDGWERTRIPATRCPRISPTFLAAERAAMPPWVFAQEYLCEFSEDEAAVFPHELVESMLDDAEPEFAKERDAA